MDKNSKVYIAGHTGLVGTALLKTLKTAGYTNLIYKTAQELDLRNQQDVNNFFEQERPEYVFLAAARVGGIYANMLYPAEFIYDNILIQTHVIHASYLYNIKKLLFLGSSCIYPKACSQPIKEDYLLSGPLEETNKPYALAKIAGLYMCQSYNKQYGTKFISCMPTNLYGPHDNFNLDNSHVIPGLIARLYKAQQEKQQTFYCWGTGNALREFLHVDDFAQAALFLMHNYTDYENTINVGSEQEISIYNLVHSIKTILDYNGTIIFDQSKPDGTLRKFLCSKRIQQLGWRARIDLNQGLKETIDWYKRYGIKY